MKNDIEVISSPLATFHHSKGLCMFLCPFMHKCQLTTNNNPTIFSPY